MKNDTAKERPILFSTPMVQAEQDGRKTHTRRAQGLEVMNENPDNWKLSKETYIDKKGRLCQKFFRNTIGSEVAACPYGKVGDLLWVREMFIDSMDYPCADYHEDPENEPRWIYKADCPKDQHDVATWKPSIFMPKIAARIWLRVVDVRVERLQEISEYAAQEEGIDQDTLYYDYLQKKHNLVDPIYSFQTLWQSINGRGSWEENPWVWVVEFERVDRQIN